MKTVKKDKKPILVHFNELLQRLKFCLIWIIIGTALSYLFVDQIIEWILLPYNKIYPNHKLIFIQAFEKIWAYLRISGYIGFAVALPVVFFEIYKFVSPGLKKNENKVLRNSALSFFVVFPLGLAMGYFLVLPVLLKHVLSFGSDQTEAWLTLSSYINVFLGVLIFSGILLNVPVIMGLFSKLNWMPAEYWKKGRRYAVVVNSILAALLSPPDPMSMFFMFIPLLLLYEVGVFVASRQAPC